MPTLQIAPRSSHRVPLAPRRHHVRHRCRRHHARHDCPTIAPAASAAAPPHQRPRTLPPRTSPRSPGSSHDMQSLSAWDDRGFWSTRARQTPHSLILTHAEAAVGTRQGRFSGISLYTEGPTHSLFFTAPLGGVLGAIALTRFHAGVAWSDPVSADAGATCAFQSFSSSGRSAA